VTRATLFLVEISRLLLKEIDPAKIRSPRVRNEVMALLELAKVGTSLEIPEDLRELAQRRKVPRFVRKIVLLDIPAANAFAFTKDGSPTIAITLGVPMITRALFLAAISGAEVFHGMHDVHYLRTPYTPSKHCDWSGLIDLLTTFSLEKLYAWAESLPEMPQTADNDGRGDLAIILSMQAWIFIVFHELGHHASGHVEETAGRHANLALAEIEESIAANASLAKPSDLLFENTPVAAGLSESLLLRHAKELEADQVAIALMYQNFFRGDPQVKLRSTNFKKMTTISERSRTRLWLVTTGLVFLLFEAASRGRASTSHPRPLFRLQHLLEFTFMLADTVLPSASRNEFDIGFGDAMRDLTSIASHLGVHDLGVPQLDEALYKNRLMTIRPSLSRVLKNASPKE